MQKFPVQSETGFSFMELLVSMVVLIPVMAAAIGMFSVGASHHAIGQNAIDVSQDARTAMEMMTTEIAQAGSHADVRTIAPSTIVNSMTAQSVQVESTAGFTAGDYVDVDVEPNDEIVQLTAVSGTRLTGVFRLDHGPNTPIRLPAMPYVTGIIPPSGLGPNSSATVTTLRFFGHIQGSNSDANENDPTVHYVEYGYDSANEQITRSITPITQSTKNPALPFVRNVKPSSVRFTLNTDVLGVVTSANIAMTVKNSVKSGTKYQEAPLASRITIPSAIAASELLWEYQHYRGLYPLPPTPSIVRTWAGQLQ